MARIRLERGQLGRTIQGEARRALRNRAPQVLNRAKILAPVDTGRLRASGKIVYSSTFGFRPKATIVFDVDYAAAVHDGSKPHQIRPKTRRVKQSNGKFKGGVLRFQVGGRVVYATVVNHPGTKGKPFLDRALREVAAPAGYSIRNV